MKNVEEEIAKAVTKKVEKRLQKFVSGFVDNFSQMSGDIGEYEDYQIIDEVELLAGSMDKGEILAGMVSDDDDVYTDIVDGDRYCWSANY